MHSSPNTVNVLVLRTVDNRTIELPVRATDKGRRFLADQTALPEELDIADICLIRQVGPPIHFALETFVLLEGEVGSWEITIGDGDDGLPQFDLEYQMLEQFGETVWPPLIMQWDHEKQDLLGC
jgi:hypothetical protein